MVSRLQSKVEMDKVIFTPNLEHSTTWLQRSISKLHIRANRSTYLLLPWFSSSWLPSTLHLPKQRLMIHSINALQEIGLTYSGELIARTSQEVRAISLRNSRSCLLACFRLSLPTGLQCLRSWPILGCKKRPQLSRISKQDSNKGTLRWEKRCRKKDRANKLRNNKEWEREELP